MFKLIASDMDETFLDIAHRIPASNLESSGLCRNQSADRLAFP